MNGSTPLRKFIAKCYVPHAAAKTERRDRAIIEAAAEGLTPAAIAEEFGLSERTIRFIIKDRLEYIGRNYRAMEKSLNRTLCRAPAVADLNPATFERFAIWLAEKRRGQKYQKCFATLWRHAFVCGLAEIDPGPRVDLGGIRRKFPKADGSLAAFFADVFALKLAAEGGEQTVKRYTRAVELFEDFRGGTVLLDRLEPTSADGFDAWLSDRLSPIVAKKYGQFARRVLREARPDVFTRKRGWHRKNDAPEAPEGSIRHFFRTVYRPLKLIGAAITTVEQMEISLNRLAHVHGRELMLDELSDETLSGMMEWMLAEGLSTNTVNGARGYLCAIWRVAHERRLLETLPRVRKVRVHLHEPDSWTAEELMLILESVDLERGQYVGIERSLWWRAFLLVGYYTALRRGALLRLRRQDVNLATGWIDVPPHFMKNRRGKKFRIGPDAIEAVANICPRTDSRTDPRALFPWPLERSTINHHWKRLLVRAGLPTGRRQGPHKLRRTTATMVAVEAGMHAAMSILGHSEEYMTMRYVDPSKLPGADATKFLPPLIQERC